MKPVVESPFGNATVSKDGRSIEAEIVPVDEPNTLHTTLSCVSIFASDYGKFGIRNNCGECKRAVVKWSNHPQPWRYTVNGYSEISVDIQGSHGQLIGEEPC